MTKPRSWFLVLTMVVMASLLVQAARVAGGVILISTRAPQDTAAGDEYMTDVKGPGMVTPGDVAMAVVLGNHGYSCRLILDRLLGAAGVGWVTAPPAPEIFLQPANTNMAICLAIMSGSGSSADTPPPPPGVPVMMGEHVCLGNNAGRPGSLFMYNGTASNDPSQSTTPPATRYMKVLAPDHPILQGIPLDAQGRIKIFRDPYPDEEAYVPVGGKVNYEYRWCAQAVADAAAGVTVLGVLDGAEDRACFAVADVGGVLANGLATDVRLVHLFLNENGSGGSRRVFLALTEWGRVLFVRAAKWAMGEQLTPYKTIRIKDVTMIGAARVNLAWEGSSHQTYRIHASTDLSDWHLVVEDIPGLDGLVNRKLDLAAVPATVFFRISSIP